MGVLGIPTLPSMRGLSVSKSLGSIVSFSPTGSQASKGRDQLCLNFTMSMRGRKAANEVGDVRRQALCRWLRRMTRP
jgi:hypothetical protein